MRFLCLHDELETSRELLRSGFGHLQEIRHGRNTFYNLPHQLLASDFERLMKYYIAVVHKGRDGAYPDRASMKSLGHDLESLLETICTKHYGGTQRPRVQQDHAFIRTDPVLSDCVRILSLFGKMGRYYNLDVVAGAGHGPIGPRGEWEALESRVEDPIPYLGNLERLPRDYYPRVNSVLIAKMERLVRAIAMQYHPWGACRPRRFNLDGSQTFTRSSGTSGTTNSALSTIAVRWRSSGVTTTNGSEALRPGDRGIGLAVACSRQGRVRGRVAVPRRLRVTVECRDGLFCIVNIGGYDFALNGAARSRFG